MYEKEVHATEGTRELYYINTPSGISAILESTSSYDSIFYIHTDILSSYDVITDDQGGIRERLSFDPWGRRRNTSSWDYTGVPTSFKFDRGFTGHEHLDDFDLINMNGRMYDPILAMFLSPDPFIQSPHETQNFNRYAYVINNPLKYVDPTGYSYDPIGDDWTDVYWYDPYPYDVPPEERSYRYTMTWYGVQFWGTKSAWNSAHGILPGGPTGMDYDAWDNSIAPRLGIDFMSWYNQGGRYGSEGFYSKTPAICLGYNGRKGKGFYCGEAGVIWSKPKWIYVPYCTNEDPSGLLSRLKNKLPVAVSWEITGSGEGLVFAGQGSLIGGGIVLQGENAGQIFGYSAFGAGSGWIGASAGISRTFYFYTGNINNFDQYSLDGWSGNLIISLGAGPSGALTLSLAKDRFGDYIIGFCTGAGAGVSPTIVSGQYTIQKTYIWGYGQ